jgi:FkbM family methyltransferase
MLSSPIRGSSGIWKKNLAMNGFRNVHLFNLAMGNVEDRVSFSNIRSDDQNAIVPQGRGIDVRARPLDAMRMSDPVIHLLKIDTEGYEKFVLLGASKVLEKTLTVYFESWDQSSERYGYQPQEVFRLLQKAGFAVFKLHDGALRPISEEYSSSRVENLLALRAPKHFLERTRLGEAR